MSRRLAMLEQMIEKGSKDPFVHYARAMELSSLERFEDALAAYEELAESHPAYVPTYLMGGQLAEKLGRLEQARSFLERGVVAATNAGAAKALSEIRGLLAGL